MTALIAQQKTLLKSPAKIDCSHTGLAGLPANTIRTVMDSVSSDPKNSAFESFMFLSVGDSVQRTAVRSTQSSIIEPVTSLQAALACSISHADWCSPAPHGGTVYRVTGGPCGCISAAGVGTHAPCQRLHPSRPFPSGEPCGSHAVLAVRFPRCVAAAGDANYPDFLVTRQQVFSFTRSHVA